MDDIKPQWKSGATHKTFGAFHVLCFGISLLIFVHCPYFIQAQKLFSTLNHYTLVDGLPDNRVYAICFDSDRILWLGTAQGIVKFDGENFYNLTISNDSVKLLSQQITGISMNPGGDLWISTSKGIVRHHRGTNTFEFVYPLNSAEDWVTSILWTDKETGWFLTQRKLICIHTSELQFETYELEEPSSVFYALSPMAMDGNNTLWLTSGYALWSFNLEEKIPVRQPLPGKDEPEVWSVFNKPGHPVWIGTRSNGLYQVDDSSEVIPFGLNAQYIRGLYQTQNQLWAGGGTEGLISISLINDSIASAIIPDDYHYGMANCFAEDTVQNLLWIGTQDGLLKLDSRKEIFSTTTLQIQNDGYPPYVLNVLPDQNDANILWLKIIDQGIGKWNQRDQSLKLYTPKTAFGKSNACFIQDQNGLIWTTVYSLPCVRIFNPFNESWSSPSLNHAWSDTRYIFQDNHAKIWLGTGESTLGYLLDNDRMQEIQDLPDLIHDSINSGIFTIDQLPSGDIWTITDQQIFKINPADHSVKEIKLFETGQDNQMQLLSIFASSSNTIWVGAREGLWQLDEEGNILQFFLNNGTDQFGYIYKIVEDERGMIWLGSNNGLFRVNPKTKHIRQLTTKDGLLRDQAFFLSIDKNDILYVGFPNAFQSLNTRYYDIDTFIPPLKLLDFKIMDRSITASENQVITISPNENYFTIYYASMNYRQPELNNYKYRLEGFESNWHDVQGNNLASYSNLPAGNYAFELQGSNNDGIWTPIYSLAKIKVIAVFYKTTWFKITAMLILSGLIWLYWYIRKTEQEKLKRLRIQIARDLHDEIGSSLSSIGFLSEFVRNQAKSSPSNIDSLMQKISSTAGSISDAMASIIWTLQDEQPHFEHIIQRIRAFGGRLADAEGSNLEISVDPAVSEMKFTVSQLKHLYLICKEGLNNAAKYAGPCDIDLTFKKENNRLRIRLADTGKGCDLDIVAYGNGLKNIRNRVSDLGGYCHMFSKIGQGFTMDIVL